MHKIISSTIFTSLSLMGLSSVAQSGPQNLPQEQAACFNSKANAISLKSLLDHPDALSSCKSQIEASFKKCGMISVESLGFLVQNPDAAETTSTAQILRQNSDLYRNNSSVCRLELTVAAKACRDAENTLREEALRTAAEYRQALSQVPFDGSRYQMESAVRLKYDQKNSELARKSKFALQFHQSLDRTFGDKANCYFLHSAYSADLGRKVDGAVAGKSKLPSGTRFPAEHGERNTRGTDLQAGDIAADKVFEDSSELVIKETIAVTVLQYATKRLGPNNPLVIQLRDAVTLPRVTRLTSVWGGAVFFLLTATPLGGECDTIFEDPILAETRGCQVGARPNAG